MNRLQLLSSDQNMWLAIIPQLSVLNLIIRNFIAYIFIYFSSKELLLPHAHSMYSKVLLLFKTRLEILMDSDVFVLPPN